MNVQNSNAQIGKCSFDIAIRTNAFDSINGESMTYHNHIGDKDSKVVWYEDTMAFVFTDSKRIHQWQFKCKLN